MTTVHFGDAFGRWQKMTTDEHRRIEAEQKAGKTILSWEALDHVCGLAVESGMKALLIKERVVIADASGDFPVGSNQRRPHVNELWDIFMSKTSSRTMSDWIKRLADGAGSAPSVFQAWRAEHRYAPDGLVQSAVVLSRVQLFKRLKAIAQEEGI